MLWTLASMNTGQSYLHAYQLSLAYTVLCGWQRCCLSPCCASHRASHTPGCLRHWSPTWMTHRVTTQPTSHLTCKVTQCDRVFTQ
jgi:hypothetical protein